MFIQTPHIVTGQSLPTKVCLIWQVQGLYFQLVFQDFWEDFSVNINEPNRSVWATLIGWFATELLSKDIAVSESYKQTFNHYPCLQWYLWAKTSLHIGHIVSEWWEISYFASALFCFGKQSDSLLRSTLTVMQLGTCFCWKVKDDVALPWWADF